MNKLENKEEMNSKLQKNLGILFILIGSIFILNASSGITGFFIIEKIGEGISSILGLIFVALGILLFLRGRDSLRKHNKEAHYAMKKLYEEEVGEKPSKEKLKEFIRTYHERGWLPDILGDWR